METGILLALGFAAAIVLLAMVLTRLVSHRGSRGDANASCADGRATATWIGINRARGEDPDTD
ncbi:MAG: hypothetical protein VYD64_02450 [Pseudomonadota bacterium]|nr:hypothetical protein [Pseudomonadota bacterium]